MEATDDIENFPCGVKTTYRKYSATEVIEIIPSTQVGFSDRWVECPTYPLTKKLPNFSTIPPTPFKPGSRAVFEKTLNKVTVTHMLAMYLQV